MLKNNGPSTERCDTTLNSSVEVLKITLIFNLFFSVFQMAIDQL